MTLDVAELRSHFPSLTSGIAHFDGPGGTQTPREVAVAVADALCGPLSNRGRGVASERRADDAVAAFRAAMGDLLNTDPAGIVYGRSATQLTYDFAQALAKDWAPGEEIVVTSLDHDANIRPWVQTAERAGVTVRWWEFDPTTAELSVADLVELLGPATRLVAVTAASNLLGTLPPLPEIAAAVHRVGALLYVDGVHYTAHAVVDLPRLGADVFVCSPYKFFGPHCAVLAASVDLLQSLRPDKLAPATDAVPERFERGTLPYELMAGVTAAVDFIAAAAPTHEGERQDRLVAASAAFEEHERSLRDLIEPALRGWDRVRVHSNAADRTPTLFFSVEGVRSSEVYLELAASDVLLPAGSFYAQEAFRRLDRIDPDDPYGLRIGVAPYTDIDDVDRLIDGLGAILTR